MPNGEILPDWYYLDTGRARVLIFSTGFPTFPASRALPVLLQTSPPEKNNSSARR